MAKYLNKVQLIGNVGQDPEVRNVQSGDKIVSFSLATSESWTDRVSGEKRERTEWHRVVIFGNGLAGVAEQYLRKGSKVFVEGQLQTRKWQDQSGAERSTTEIALRPFKGDLILLDGNRSGGGRNGGDAEPNTHGGFDGPNAPDLDDGVPF